MKNTLAFLVFIFAVNISFSQVDGPMRWSKTDGWVSVSNTLSEKIVFDSLRIILPKGLTQMAQSAKYSKDGRYILIYSIDESVKIFDARTFFEIRTFYEEKYKLTEVSFSPDGNNILVVGNSICKIYNISSGLALFEHIDSTENINNACFSPNKKEFLVVDKSKLTVYESDLFSIKRIVQINNLKCSKYNFDGRLFFACTENSAHVYDSEKGIKKSVIECVDRRIISGNFCPISNILILCYDDGTLVSFDPNSGKKLYTYNESDHKNKSDSTPNIIEINSDGTYFALSSGFIIKIFEVSSGKLLSKIDLGYGNITSVKFSNDNKKIAVSSWSGNAYQYDIFSGKLLNLYEGHNWWVNSVEYSRDNKFILTSSNDQTCKVFYSESAEVIHTFKDKALIVTGLSISPDSKEIILSADNYSAYKFGVETGIGITEILGEMNFEPVGLGEEMFKVIYDKENKYLYSLSDLKQLKIYDAKSNNLIFAKDIRNIKLFNFLFFIESTHYRYEESIKNLFRQLFEKYGNDTLSSNNKFSIKVIDNIIQIFDINKNIIYQRLQFTNNNYLIQLPNSPYYMCSKEASKMLHYVTPSLKVIGFEQLDPVYNRPDIVLDSIGKYFGGADQELVENYRNAWERRINRLGLDKEKLGKGEIAVPNAEIVNADSINYENKDGKVVIHIAANDSKYLLQRYNVYVNEVPLYGSQGISISKLKTNNWQKTDTISLSAGENKIQVSVMNELGLENFKYPLFVNYEPTNEEIAKTHYIGIGVNKFKESKYNLNYCVKDIQDLAKEIGEKNTSIKLYTDKEVNRENILKLKKYLKDSTCIDDRVIISCSSHGLLDDSLNFYLAMQDVDFKNPKERGLRYEELEDLLDGIPARKKLLLLDACNSGENDKTEKIQNNIKKENTKPDQELYTSKGIIQDNIQTENKFQKINELFVNVHNNTGSIVISAAGGQESALEAIKVDGKAIENGAFTYSILEYLRKNKDLKEKQSVNQLKKYVEQRVVELTNGKQNPTSRQETMEVDWKLK